MNLTQDSPSVSVHGGPVVRGKRRRRDPLDPLLGWHFAGQYSAPILLSVQGHDVAIVVGHGYPLAVAAVDPVIGRLNTAAWCKHDIAFVDWPGIQREDPVEEKFIGLVEQLRGETAGFSSPTRITGHPAYLSIVAMEPKPRVISLVLMDLRENGGFWYPALRALTNENPVPVSARGQTQLMDEAWLKWGRQHGLIE